MYRHCYWHPFEKVIKLKTWNKSGKRLTVDVPFNPYLYIESPRGEYLSIFEKPVEKVEFNTPGQRTKFIKSYGTRRYYENFDVTQQFLLDHFWDKYDQPGFDANPLRILFFDIEVDETKDGSFPEAIVYRGADKSQIDLDKSAPSEINIITVYDSLEKTYFIFSKNAYTGKDLGENVVYKNCTTERGILLSFIEFWQSNDYPDIVTAWNLNRFDMPYIVNRICKVLGEEALTTMSPYENFYESIDKDKMGREYTKYNFAGVTILDHIDVYAKYKITKQESYKLDFIAQQELGIGKVDYQGESNIYEFMRKHWNTFVEYNVRDVELLVKLEEKTRYFQILRMVSYMGCCNFDKGMMTIPGTNGAVAIRCRQKNRVLHTFVRDVNPDEKKPGGYVSLKPGFARDCVSFDAGSLYPNAAISLNISPETKVGMAYFKKGDAYNGEDSNPVSFVFTKDNLKYDLNRGQFNKFIKEMNFCVAPNGCVFSQSTPGVFAQYMAEVFARRSAIRKEIKAHNKELETCNDKERIIFLKQEISRKDILQYALKILINSAYGAISSPKNAMGDSDLANAITTTGSTSIKHINLLARQFVLGKNPKISPEDLEAVVVFNDTDSCCIRLDKCGVQVCKNNEVTPEGYALVQECDDFIDKSFQKWFTSTTNSNKCTIYYKREKICDAGVFLKKKNKDEEAKKNYILHILDNEGVKKPTFKYTGVKFARSTLTKELKAAAKEVVEHMIVTQDKMSTESLLQRLYDRFKEMPLDDIVTIQRCNKVKEYEAILDIPYNFNIGKMTFPKGTPGHVRAAINFNIVMDKLGIKGYERVKSGDLAKIIYVHKNKFGIDKIGYLDTLPPELMEHLQIDFKTTFIKTVYDEIKRIYKSVGWTSFNPADNYYCDIFSLIDNFEPM